MEDYVVDASVIVKWFIKENFSEEARDIRDNYINGKLKLITPSLMYYEVLNAIKYRNIFDSDELNKIGESLENYGFESYELKDEFRYKMIELSLKHDLSIYDAAYVSLAITKDKILYSADEKIKKKLPKPLKNKIINLSEYKNNKKR